MKGVHKIVIWPPLLLAAIVVSFILGRMTLGPSSEPTLSELPVSTTDVGEYSGEKAQEKDMSELLSGEHGPIEAGQTWTSAELLLINAGSQELFSGNAASQELALGYEQIGRAIVPSEQARLKQVVFPDGEALDIEFDLPSFLDEDWSHLEDGVSPGFFEPLSVAASNGNGAAAHQLYTSLKVCSKAPRTPAEYNALENQLRGNYPIYQEEYIRNLQISYRRCQGTTDEMMATAVELLRQTGEAGNSLNAMKWAMEIQDAQPEVAESVFDRVWNENGRTSALSMLAGIYRDRQPASHSEAVEAFAYSYASLMLILADVDGIVGVEDLREGLIQEMMRLEYTVSYSVVQAGKALAYRLIAENPNCCY